MSAKSTARRSSRRSTPARFDTIIGKVKLENGLNKNIWAVGQWQGADFFGIAPISKQGAKPVIAKPAWQ